MKYTMYKQHSIEDVVSPTLMSVIIGMFRQGCAPETIAVVQQVQYTRVCAIIEARLDVCIEQLN